MRPLPEASVGPVVRHVFEPTRRADALTAEVGPIARCRSADPAVHDMDVGQLVLDVEVLAEPGPEP